MYWDHWGHHMHCMHHMHRHAGTRMKGTQETHSKRERVAEESEEERRRGGDGVRQLAHQP